MTLDKTQEMIVQFSFSNQKIVPRWINYHEKETLTEHSARKKRATGKMIIEPTERCSIKSIIEDIGREGFCLVDAFTQKRLKKRGHYWMVRFVFTRDNNPQENNLALNELEKLSSEAFWRVRAFLNPYYQDGKENPGKKQVSINLEAREPLYNFYGVPIAQRLKNEKGQPYGKPVPLKDQPQSILRIKEGILQLLPPQ